MATHLLVLRSKEWTVWSRLIQSKTQMDRQGRMTIVQTASIRLSSSTSRFHLLSSPLDLCYQWDFNSNCSETIGSVCV